MKSVLTEDADVRPLFPVATTCARHIILALLAVGFWTTLCANVCAQMQRGEQAPPKARPNDAALRKAVEQVQQRRVLFEAAIIEQKQLELVLEMEVIEGRSRMAMVLNGQSRPGLERSLADQLNELEHDCQLTAEQKSKLELLGRGDINRYFRHIEVIKETFPLLVENHGLNMADFRECTKMEAKSKRVLFSEDSLFIRGVSRILNPAQFAKYETACSQRVEARHRTDSQQAIRQMSRIVALSAKEQKELCDLAVNETRPDRQKRDFDPEYLLWQLSQLPKERLQTMVEAGRRSALQAYLSRIKEMGTTLGEAGYSLAQDKSSKANSDSPERKK